MQLYLIRHAESANNARPIYERVEDPSITARGRLQAEQLARWASLLKIDYLITSPFLRTLQTTRFIVDCKPQPVHVWHDLFERGGCFRGHDDRTTEGADGLGRSAILKEATSVGEQCVIDESILETGWWGGKDLETNQEVVLRAKLVTDRFVDAFGHTDATVVAVIHADFKRCLLAEMIGMTTQVESLGPLINTGVTKLSYEETSWKLHAFNSISHLPERLVTGNETFIKRK